MLFDGYLGPVSMVPWNNRVLFMCVNAMGIWMNCQGGEDQGGAPSRANNKH